MKHLLRAGLFRRILVFACILALVTVWIGASPVSAQGGVYVVHSGDTLLGIAARYGVTVSQLAAANGLYWNSWVYVGQRLTIPGQSSGYVPPAAPATGSSYVVRAGDTLSGIAMRYGISVSSLAVANGLYATSWVYTGQRLTIPGQSSGYVPPSTPATSGTYVVQRGDTLSGIAARHGLTVGQLAAANGLSWNAWVYVGQRIKIPGATTTPPAPAPSPAPPVPQPAGGTKWIDVNLSTQTLTAYEGQSVVMTARVSTGIAVYPTVVGTFHIYVKYNAARMTGPGYDLPNVPYVMYFYRGYGLHGTYWHNNFGTPMSHGCVNLSIADAQTLFNWAPVGTTVVTHY
jgi:LysM repeat protein